MNHKPPHALALVALVATTLALQACGDFDHSAQAAAQQQPSNEVPASALASSRAFSLFVGSMPMTETNEASGATKALSLDGMTAPTSETDDPIGIS